MMIMIFSFLNEKLTKKFINVAQSNGLKAKNI